MMTLPILQKFGSDNFKGDNYYKIFYLLWDYCILFRLPKYK